MFIFGNPVSSNLPKISGKRLLATVGLQWSHFVFTLHLLGGFWETHLKDNLFFNWLCIN